MIFKYSRINGKCSLQLQYVSILVTSITNISYSDVDNESQEYKDILTEITCRKMRSIRYKSDLQNADNNYYERIMLLSRIAKNRTLKLTMWKC